MKKYLFILFLIVAPHGLMAEKGGLVLMEQLTTRMEQAHVQHDAHNVKKLGKQIANLLMNGNTTKDQTLTYDNQVIADITKKQYTFRKATEDERNRLKKVIQTLAVLWKKNLNTLALGDSIYKNIQNHRKKVLEYYHEALSLNPGTLSDLADNAANSIKDTYDDSAYNGVIHGDAAIIKDKAPLWQTAFPWITTFKPTAAPEIIISPEKLNPVHDPARNPLDNPILKAFEEINGKRNESSFFGELIFANINDELSQIGRNYFREKRYDTQNYEPHGTIKLGISLDDLDVEAFKKILLEEKNRRSHYSGLTEYYDAAAFNAYAEKVLQSKEHQVALRLLGHPLEDIKQHMMTHVRRKNFIQACLNSVGNSWGEFAFSFEKQDIQRNAMRGTLHSFIPKIINQHDIHLKSTLLNFMDNYFKNVDASVKNDVNDELKKHKTDFDTLLKETQKAYAETPVKNPSAGSDKNPFDTTETTRESSAPL